jgi:hypothetical protein
MQEVYASVKKELIDEATRSHRIILPTARRIDISECFTVMCDKMVFWFNTPDGSTHILTRDLPN